MKIKLHHIIGLLIILSGLSLKSILNHNVEYWGQVKTYTILIFFVGLITLNFKLLWRIDKKPLLSFYTVPGQWIFRGFKILFALALLVATTIGLENIGIKLNGRIKDYYLTSNTKETLATVIEKRGIGYSVKTMRWQPFYIIEYTVNDETIRQGIKCENDETKNLIISNSINLAENMDNLKFNELKGLKIRLVYSEKHPTFFRIVN
ncbi:hypothetical protein [Carboxylicivirga marina]|uniref:SMODS-associating 2TM beta-strand rich effector domain-containing protein n=1 Tax=Carboxylicivirga marina TaxID=2800988 RepID=A0ABS1HKJ6_9BACT|nr:hypothetical protein [Carboxylicivirga marina]MBK3518196.1 hypothetical protein [Carboxylicivirga marina]